MELATHPTSPASDPETDALAAAAIAHAKAAGLRYVRPNAPGLSRQGRDPGSFHYLDADGKAVRDAATLERVRKLAIPPAYEAVWICADPLGHLQATGRDARGRKQYRYHADWRSVRDGHKFDRMIAFAEALPRLRRRIARDLRRPGLPREKVLALVIALLDATRVRIGNAEYARENQSYGLTTLRNRHARFVRDGRLRLVFRGKGGADHDVAVDDRRLVRIVRQCQQLPGQALFQYLDDEGQRRGIDSGQVNDYLREIGGGTAFTAKDFRTWGATLSAIARMACTPLPEPPSERAFKACIVEAVRQVAGELRNTPAVCRKAYINPVVFEAWRAGRLGAVPRGARQAEQAALRFLRTEAASAPKRRRRARAQT